MDIVIVGGGPAGLITGLMLTEQGFQPLILEKEPTIKSTTCAEGCDCISLEQFSFDIEPYVENKTIGAHIYFPGNNHFTTHIPGVILDRTAWLKGMAQTFQQHGGTLRLNAHVINVTDSAVQLSSGERIKYDVLIGADGPFSEVRKHMGIPQDLICGVQYKMECELNDNYLRFYFDKRFSAHYSWVFPKKRILNVGMAGKFAQLDSLLEYLDLADCPTIAKQAGAIPVSGVPRTLVKGKMALIGDAASMTNALSGGGLGPILYAARLLCKNITNLNNYQQAVRHHPIANPAIIRGRNALLSATNDHLEKMGSLFNGIDLRSVRRWDMIRIIKYPLLIPKFLLLGRSVEFTLRWGW